MVALASSLADSATLDFIRGAAAVLAAVLAVMAVASWLILTRSGGLLPSWVRWALAGWAIGDVYVSSREMQQIGHPMFWLGLPLAIAWEVCAVVYLYRIWTATDRLRRRPSDW